MKAPRGLALVVVPCMLAVLIAASAYAAPPVELSSDRQLTDQADVVRDDARVERELEAVHEGRHVQLFVVYVDSFDGEPAQQWAEATAHRNGCGNSDMVLAVAVRDRRFAWSVSEGFPLSDAALRQMAADDIQPELERSHWQDAAVAAARGLDARLAGARGTRTPSIAVLGLIALACVAPVLLAIRLAPLVHDWAHEGGGGKGEPYASE